MGAIETLGRHGSRKQHLDKGKDKNIHMGLIVERIQSYRTTNKDESTKHMKHKQIISIKQKSVGYNALHIKIITLHFSVKE